MYNTTDTIITLPYIDTLTANGCTNIQTLWATVYPTPKLSSTVSPAAICNNSVFTYVSASNTPGTTFSWSRYSQIGISDSTAMGINNPSETLHDTTANPVNVVYYDTLKANGCVHTQALTVMVNPTVQLSSKILDTVCSGAPYLYVAGSHTNNFTYTWFRDTVAGVMPYSSTGSGNIQDTLTGNGIQTSVIYHFVFNINNCLDSEDLKLTINPLPLLPSIDTKCPATVCEQTMFANFGTNNPAGSIKTYQWQATNASIYNAGSGNQYCLVNFPNSGTASVKLIAVLNASGCENEISYTVNVSSNTIGINPDVIYVNGEFICLDNSADAYQWGYDNALTLDSTLLPGKNTQSFYDPTADIVNNNYWIMLTKNGCTQKYYYNAPPASNSNVVKSENKGITLYPNPAGDKVFIQMSGTISQTYQILISNLMGEILVKKNDIEATSEMNIANLPSGIYNVMVISANHQLGHATLIKN